MAGAGGRRPRWGRNTNCAGFGLKEIEVGTLFSSLDIARSGLQTSQVQLDVAAHNIANVNKEGFSRQRVDLATRSPISRPFGQIGRGVQVQQIARVRDEFLDTAFRAAAPSLGRAELETRFFGQLQDAFLEPGENAFGARVNQFFDVMSDFANNVEQTPLRQSVITEAESVANFLRQTTVRIGDLRTNANAEVRNAAPEINSLSERIAVLNARITRAELGGTQASDLRDERDLLVDQLANIVDINVSQRESGELNIFVGDEILVDGQERRRVEARMNPAIDPTRPDFVQIQFEDNGNLLPAANGELAGALRMRDEVLREALDDVNTLAAGLIHGINRVHSQGNGLVNYSGTIEGTNAVADTAAPLSESGGLFPPQSGTFDLVLYDADGNPTVNTIDVDVNGSLQDLAAEISNVAGVSASITGDNRLAIDVDPASTFSFANDTAGILPALGVNGLFTGTGAADIGINQQIRSNPGLLTSSFSLDPADTGDNSAALAMADVRDQRILDGGNASVNEFYESVIVELGVNARTTEQQLNLERVFVDDFQRRRQEISGVSLDEEVTLMLQYQRAFEASTRVITTTDRMLEALINIVR